MSGDQDQILEHYEYKDQEFKFNSEVMRNPLKIFDHGGKVVRSAFLKR